MIESTGRLRASEARRSEVRAAYLMLSPALLLFVVFLAGPLLGSVVISTLRWDLLTPPRFAGFDNYVRLTQDTQLLRAIANTFVFSFWSMVLHLFFGLVLALGVNSRLPRGMTYAMKVAYVFPFLLSWSAVSLLWKYILDPNFGFFNYYLKHWFQMQPPNWLVSEAYALPAIIGVDFWKTLGYTFIIILAGLQTVPENLLEAGRVDGAGRWRVLYYITLPLLSPTLFFAMVITFIGSFQIFEPMFIMTKGGPGNATRSVVQHLYEAGFQQFNMGYASVVSLLIFAVIMAATFIQFRVARSWVHYD